MRITEKRNHTVSFILGLHIIFLPACWSLSTQEVAHKYSLPEVLFLVTICVHRVLDQHSASVSAVLCCSKTVQSTVSQVWTSVPDKACGAPLLHGKSLFFSLDKRPVEEMAEERRSEREGAAPVMEYPLGWFFSSLRCLFFYAFKRLQHKTTNKRSSQGMEIAFVQTA